MGWQFAPARPTEPGLYVVVDDCAGARARLMTWSRESTAWRLGARVERVDAFYGPIPAVTFPHAEVERLFAPPAREVPLRQQRPHRSNRR